VLVRAEKEINLILSQVKWKRPWSLHKDNCAHESQQIPLHSVYPQFQEC